MTAAVLRADARALPLPDSSVDLICTSPPFYALRDYRDGGASLAGQIGAEPTPTDYVDNLIAATAEWARVLRPSGSIFVNLGDKYGRPGGGADVNPRSLPGAGRGTTLRVRTATDGGGRDKSLMLLPERYRIACIDQLGLIARAVICWSKPNGLPESVQDRVRRSHEDWVHLTLRPQYYSAVDEIRQPASGYERRNVSQRATPNGQRRRAMADTCNPLGALPGSVWEVASQPFSPPVHVAHARCCGGRDKTCDRGLAHYAAFPPALVRRFILGWSPPGICTACGEGRRPVVDAQRMLDGQPRDDLPAWADPKAPRRTPNGIGHWRYGTDRRLTGYACACPTPDAPTRPAVVVDPFGGTGTVAMTASVLGRRGLSVDLSHDYGRLARWRIRDPRERARAAGVTPPPPVAPDQGDLFAELEAG